MFKFTKIKILLSTKISQVLCRVRYRWSRTWDFIPTYKWNCKELCVNGAGVDGRWEWKMVARRGFSYVQFNKSIAWANTTEHNEELSISLPDNTEMESKGKYCQFPAFVRGK